MDTRDVINILKKLPPCHLRLLDYAQLVIGEDGEPDMHKVTLYAKEMTEAVTEAEAYTKATRSVVEWLKRLAHSQS